MRFLTPKPTIVLVATYPPRECGIATFTQDLVHALRTIVGESAVIRVVAINQPSANARLYPQEVVWSIDQENQDDYRWLAEELNGDESVKAVIVQHEYGIFGGEHGSYLLDFMERLRKPVLTSMHTVLSQPDQSIKLITQKLIEYSDKVIVLSKESKEILEKVYQLPPDVVQYIPHGIHPTVFQTAAQVKPRLGLGKHTVVSTFGLLSRGKGIEYVIRALPDVIEQHPDLLYLVLGETHPVVRRQEGESYRQELLNLVDELGISEHVVFHDHYLSVEDILTYLQATDVYIATSLSPEQSVSGTFSYALGAGRAVISTAFRQAREVITPDVGRIVPIGDSAAYKDALLDILANPEELKKMHREAYKRTRTMIWPNVAHEYAELFSSLPGSELPPQWYVPEIKTTHLTRMTDYFGLLQFSTYDQPNRAYGYTLDDNARAAIAVMYLAKSDLLPRQQATELVDTYLSFVERCQQRGGTFVNYLSGDKLTRTGQNDDEDLSDCIGRCWWMLGEVSSCLWLPERIRARAQQLLDAVSHHPETPNHIRSLAFKILGLVALCAIDEERWSPQLTVTTHQLISHYEGTRTPEWDWFEPSLTYANGMLPYALWRAHAVMKDEAVYQAAKQSLEFLIKQCFFGDVYVPIGQRLWSNMYGVRGFFDQQPEDPASTILALHEALRQTHDDRYLRLLRKCFSWFLGNNILGEPLYNPYEGGCFDGLSKAGANLNQGAESLVSYLFARWAVEGVESTKN